MDSLRFLARRARRHWQILLTLSLGVIMATALLASGPLLVDTVVEMGLRLTFGSASVIDTNLRLSTVAGPDMFDFQALDGEIRNLVRAAVGEHLDSITWSAQPTRWAYPWVAGEPAAEPLVGLQAYQGIHGHLEYIGGGWRVDASAGPEAAVALDDRVIPVVVGETMARALVLRVGDLLPLSLEQNSAAPDFWFEVAGIARPRDPLDPYWFGELSPLAAYDNGEGVAGYRAIVAEELFSPAVSTLFPQDDVSLAWHTLLDPATFSAADAAPFQAQLAELQAWLDTLGRGITLDTGVPDILARFEMQLESIRVPLYILIAEVMLLALYFVTMVAALSMRQVEREFAILRSRGMSGRQLVRIQLVEATVVVAVALFTGPWLGAGFVRALSWIGPLADLEQEPWGARPGQAAWIAAGAGALACLVCLLLPLRPALKRSIVTHQQMASRNTRTPWWQRYYLDVFALAGGLILLWRLRLYGEMVSGGPGGARLDWLLLLAPVVLLLGTATISLRLFPLLLRLAASLAARGPGLESALALWQSARDPTHVTRLVLLLALAIALGVLSMGLNTTLDQSEIDRANYLAGVDLRLTSRQAVPLLDLESAPGVVRLSGVWRGRGTVDVDDAGDTPDF
ncbi:MAG: hypothetical protein JXM73_10660, partial [Anaerolineae bacterium]|nr:hypothetical protein [Anaerolineae bacterium]